MEPVTPVPQLGDGSQQLFGNAKRTHSIPDPKIGDIDDMALAITQFEVVG